MNIAIEEISSCRRRLRIEIPHRDVQTERSKLLQDFQQHAAIKGFRPGKAPASMVEKKYRKEIDSEVRRTLIPRAYREAIKQKKLNVVSQPNVEDLNYQDGLSLSFSTVVDLAPEFSLPTYKGIRLQKADSQVTDEDIAKVTTHLREQHAHYHDLDPRPARNGDYAVISFTGTVDGQPLSTLDPDAPQLSEQKKFWIRLDPGEFLPGFAEQLTGASPGDERTVTVNFPADFPRELLRGKTASYQVTLEALKEKHLPELDDPLAQEIAKCPAPELLERIRTSLAQDKENKARNQQTQQLLQHLNQAVQFELPESVVEDATRQHIQDIVRENQMRGIPDHVLQENSQQIIEGASASAKDRVKTNFILAKIADAESIEVSSDELSREIHLLSHQYEMPPATLFQRLEENGGILRLQDDIRRRKTIDFLLQSAAIA